MIINEENIPITKTEIYPTIFDYALPDGYHFQSEKTNWGQHIFGGDPLENHYIVKKDENENKPKENLHE